jgi:hypothetical protein
MNQESSFRLQLSCSDLDESSLQAITREVVKSLRDENVGQATLLQPTAQSGAKGDPFSIGNIVLALVGSGGVAVSLVHVLKAYVERKPTLKFELVKPDGTKLSFTAENLADKGQMKKAGSMVGRLITS